MTTQIREPETIAAAADAEDVRAAAAGDTRAFERLYRRHLARIYSLARRMVGEDEADEATQDSFIRAWDRLGSFRGDAAFGTWLYRVALNVILSRRSALARTKSRFLDDDRGVERLTAPRDTPEIRMDLDAALGRLPSGAREVFVLHDVEGFKHQEIAEMLRITAGTSKSQLHRARMLLREHLEE